MIGKAEVDAVLACLRDLSSREMCDEVSVNFAFVSSKAARKRMVRALALSPDDATFGCQVRRLYRTYRDDWRSMTCIKHSAEQPFSVGVQHGVDVESIPFAGVS